MELKPCPFCGNEVHLKAMPLWRPGGHGYYGCYEYIIRCDNIECGCRLANLGKNNTIYSTTEEAERNAAEAWNRRAGDAQPVRHGRWEASYMDDALVCSECVNYWIYKGYQYDYHHCPNCGAKMDGGANPDC